MSGPYSKDLRERVVAAVEGEGLSRRAAAARFGVGVSTAINWVRAYREEDGRLEPKRRGGRRPRSIRAGDRTWLRARIARGEFTIRGLVAELAEARGLSVDYKTMWKFLRAEGLSFKKNRGGQRAWAAGRRPQAAPVEGASG